MSSPYTNPKMRTGFTIHQILQKQKNARKRQLFEHYSPKPAAVGNFPMFTPGTFANISEHFEHFAPFSEHSVQINLKKRKELQTQPLLYFICLVLK